MDWADELAAAAAANGAPQVVNDSKTPSGTVHVGSLRGPVVHDAIWRALRERGVDARFLYGVDDMDPMDNQALLSGDASTATWARRSCACPRRPAATAAPNYAPAFMGSVPRHVRRPRHPSRAVLDERSVRRRRDRPIPPAAPSTVPRWSSTSTGGSATSRRPAGWLPVMVICERCGKVGTTNATDWDGETVRVRLRARRRDLGHAAAASSGRISPFGGRAKLPWNLDWAAQWSHFGVTIEGCGKDLATAGGSRDRSDAIAREVFEREPPLNVAYEFLNVGGRKMSTSRGTGAAAHTIAEVVPPQQLRFLFLRPRPNQVIEFDPDGTDAIPRLFDEFDRIADATAGRAVKGELPPNPDRLFALFARRSGRRRGSRRPPPSGRRSCISSLILQAGKDPVPYFEAEKGSALTAREREILDERIAAVDALARRSTRRNRARYRGRARRGARRGDAACRRAAPLSLGVGSRASPRPSGRARRRRRRGRR